MNPDILRQREGFQLNYNLPYRLYDTCVYPRPSPNGSTVIVCAHEEGLRVIWYSGRKFKTASTPTVNGNTINLIDDDASKQTDFEDTEDEVDPTRPYADVLTFTDIPLGAAATSIAAPPSASEEANDGLPAILVSHMVLAVACSDLSLRLIALPLRPSQQGGEEPQQMRILGVNSHRDLLSGVAITVTADTSEGDKGADPRTRSRSRVRIPEQATTVADKPKSWSFLLASTSTTGNGLLLFHQIPVNEHGQFSTDLEDHIPIQRQYLRSSLAKCSLSFNSSTFPAERHSTLLLALHDTAAVKIFQSLPSVPTIRKRRGSTATNDSALSTTRSIRQTSSKDGSTLITLLPPFNPPGPRDLVSMRKKILDAEWILNGRAVMTLMEDGEWGVWDIEAAGPTSSSNNLVKGQSNVSGIQGGALTKFAIKGTIGASVSTTKSSSSENSKPATNSSLAPMTPHTRKTKSEGLFKGASARQDVRMSSSQHRSGHIVVNRAAFGSEGNLNSTDETILLNYGTYNAVIPSLQACWRSETGGKGAFDSLRLVSLPQLQMVDEVDTKPLLLPNRSQAANGLFGTTRANPDFLISSPSRLIIFTGPMSRVSGILGTASLPMRTITNQPASADQVLLQSGELDVEGMDRILDSMVDNRTAIAPSTNGIGSKNVGFSFGRSHGNDDNDDDSDVDMGTPTQPKSAKSKLVVNKLQDREGGRRIFT